MDMPAKGYSVKIINNDTGEEFESILEGGTFHLSLTKDIQKLHRVGECREDFVSKGINFELKGYEKNRNYQKEYYEAYRRLKSPGQNEEQTDFCYACERPSQIETIKGRRKTVWRGVEVEHDDYYYLCPLCGEKAWSSDLPDPLELAKKEYEKFMEKGL